MITPPYIQYMRMRNRMAAPHIRQNFHSRNVSSLPRDSAELNPMWRSEGSRAVGIVMRTTSVCHPPIRRRELWRWKSVGIGLGDCVGNKEEFSWCSGSWRMSERRGLKMRRVLGRLFECWGDLKALSWGSVQGMKIYSDSHCSGEQRSHGTTSTSVGNIVLSWASAHPCATIQAPPPCNCPPFVLELRVPRGTCPGQFLPRYFALGLHVLLLAYRWKMAYLLLDICCYRSCAWFPALPA